MRKWIMAIVCLMTMVVFTSCSSTYVITANYEICYPDGTRPYNETVKVRSMSTPDVVCFSYSGTNYISTFTTDGIGKDYTPKRSQRNIASSTAPMRLNSYNVESKKKKNRNGRDDMYN